MAIDKDGRVTETVERSIVKILHPNGRIRFKVDKRFGSKQTGNLKRYVKYFDDLDEARAYLKEILGTQHKGRKWKAYVYFFKNLDTGHIKIGKATNPRARFSSVSANMKTHRALYGQEPPKLKILGWIEQCIDVNEDQLHLKFRKKRVSGEWFEGSIEKEIKKLLKAKKGFKP